jgi:hypothetical protein
MQLHGAPLPSELEFALATWRFLFLSPPIIRRRPSILDKSLHILTCIHRFRRAVEVQRLLGDHFSLHTHTG